MTTPDLSRPCEECGAEINTECDFFCTARTDHVTEQPDDEPSPDITVAGLAAELGFTVREIGLLVTKLCREHGPKNVVLAAAISRARTVLHGKTADLIRTELAGI